MAEKINPSDTSYDAILRKAAKQKQASLFSLSKMYPAYIALLITLIFSLGLWRLVDNQVKSEMYNSYDKAVTSVMTRFETEYQKNSQVLTSVSGLYNNLVQVVKDYFNLYASIPAKTQSSLISVMYVNQIGNEGLEDFYYYVRAQGLFDYVIHPGGVRDKYYPVQFIVPEDVNLHMSGLDLGTIPQAKAAIKKAMENNENTATPAFEIREDTSAFLLMAPVYKRGAPINSVENRVKNYDGSVVLEIDAKKFFKLSLGSGSQSDTSIIFQCYNPAENGKKGKLIYASENADLLKKDYIPEIESRKELQIANKKYIVKFSTIPEFGGSLQKYAPLITLIVSLLLSGLAFGFIVNIINRRQSALGLAERMTRSQRRIVESSNDIIAILDLNGYWKTMNPASLKILEYEPDEMIGEKIDDFIAEDYQRDELYNLFQNPTEEITHKIDVQMKSKTGENKWVSLSLSVSQIESLVYVTGRDVTIDKIAEEQEKIRNKQVRLAEQLSRETSEFKTNFFAKLSLQLRNSLTGILGYLELVSLNAYENEEEHDAYIDEATRSSREILNFVSDTSDTWGITESEKTVDDTIKVMTAVKVAKPVNAAAESYKDKNKDELKFELDDSLNDKIAVTDDKHLTETLESVFELFTEGIDGGSIKAEAEDLGKENATALKITAPNLELLADMIDVYNENEDKVVEALKYDKKDYLLRLAIAASNFRMLNGKVKFHNLGAEGNQIVIKISNKVQEEEEIQN